MSEVLRQAMERIPDEVLDERPPGTAPPAPSRTTEAVENDGTPAAPATDVTPPNAAPVVDSGVASNEEATPSLS